MSGKWSFNAGSRERYAPSIQKFLNRLEDEISDSPILKEKFKSEQNLSDAAVMRLLFSDGKGLRATAIARAIRQVDGLKESDAYKVVKPFIASMCRSSGKSTIQTCSDLLQCSNDAFPTDVQRAFDKLGIQNGMHGVLFPKYRAGETDALAQANAELLEATTENDKITADKAVIDGWLGSLDTTQTLQASGFPAYSNALDDMKSDAGREVKAAFEDEANKDSTVQETYNLVKSAFEQKVQQAVELVAQKTTAKEEAEQAAAAAQVGPTVETERLASEAAVVELQEATTENDKITADKAVIEGWLGSLDTTQTLQASGFPAYSNALDDMKSDAGREVKAAFEDEANKDTTVQDTYNLVKSAFEQKVQQAVELVAQKTTAKQEAETKFREAEQAAAAAQVGPTVETERLAAEAAVVELQEATTENDKITADKAVIDGWLGSLDTTQTLQASGFPAYSNALDDMKSDAGLEVKAAFQAEANKDSTVQETYNLVKSAFEQKVQDAVDLVAQKTTAKEEAETKFREAEQAAAAAPSGGGGGSSSGGGGPPPGQSGGNINTLGVAPSIPISDSGVLETGLMPDDTWTVGYCCFKKLRDLQTPAPNTDGFESLLYVDKSTITIPCHKNHDDHWLIESAFDDEGNIQEAKLIYSTTKFFRESRQSGDVPSSSQGEVMVQINRIDKQNPSGTIVLTFDSEFTEEKDERREFDGDDNLKLVKAITSHWIGGTEIRLKGSEHDSLQTIKEGDLIKHQHLLLCKKTKIPVVYTVVGNIFSPDDFDSELTRMLDYGESRNIQVGTGPDQLNADNILKSQDKRVVRYTPFSYRAYFKLPTDTDLNTGYIKSYDSLKMVEEEYDFQQARKIFEDNGSISSYETTDATNSNYYRLTDSMAKLGENPEDDENVKFLSRLIPGKKLETADVLKNMVIKQSDTYYQLEMDPHYFLRILPLKSQEEENTTARKTFQRIGFFPDEIDGAVSKTMTTVKGGNPPQVRANFNILLSRLKSALKVGDFRSLKWGNKLKRILGTDGVPRQHFTFVTRQGVYSMILSKKEIKKVSTTSAYVSGRGGYTNDPAVFASDKNTFIELRRIRSTSRPHVSEQNVEDCANNAIVSQNHYQKIVGEPMWMLDSTEISEMTESDIETKINELQKGMQNFQEGAFDDFPHGSIVVESGSRTIQLGNDLTKLESDKFELKIEALQLELSTRPIILNRTLVDADIGTLTDLMRRNDESIDFENPKDSQVDFQFSQFDYTKTELKDGKQKRNKFFEDLHQLYKDQDALHQAIQTNMASFYSKLVAISSLSIRQLDIYNNRYGILTQSTVSDKAIYPGGGTLVENLCKFSSRFLIPPLSTTDFKDLFIDQKGKGCFKGLANPYRSFYVFVLVSDGTANLVSPGQKIAIALIPTPHMLVPNDPENKDYTSLKEKHEQKIMWCFFDNAVDSSAAPHLRKLEELPLDAETAQQYGHCPYENYMDKLTTRAQMAGKLNASGLPNPPRSDNQYPITKGYHYSMASADEQVPDHKPVWQDDTVKADRTKNYWVHPTGKGTAKLNNCGKDNDWLDLHSANSTIAYSNPAKQDHYYQKLSTYSPFKADNAESTKRNNESLRVHEFNFVGYLPDGYGKPSIAYSYASYGNIVPTDNTYGANGDRIFIENVVQQRANRALLNGQDLAGVTGLVLSNMPIKTKLALEVLDEHCGIGANNETYVRQWVPADRVAPEVWDIFKINRNFPANRDELNAWNKVQLQAVEENEEAKMLFPSLFHGKDGPAKLAKLKPYYLDWEQVSSQKKIRKDDPWVYYLDREPSAAGAVPTVQNMKITVPAATDRGLQTEGWNFLGDTDGEWKKYLFDELGLASELVLKRSDQGAVGDVKGSLEFRACADTLKRKYDEDIADANNKLEAYLKEKEKALTERTKQLNASEKIKQFELEKNRKMKDMLAREKALSGAAEEKEEEVDAAGESAQLSDSAVKTLSTEAQEQLAQFEVRLEQEAGFEDKKKFIEEELLKGAALSGAPPAKIKIIAAQKIKKESDKAEVFEVGKVQNSVTSALTDAPAKMTASEIAQTADFATSKTFEQSAKALENAREDMANAVNSIDPQSSVLKAESGAIKTAKDNLTRVILDLYLNLRY